MVLTLKSQADVTEYLLSKAHLAIVPFYAFGAEKQFSLVQVKCRHLYIK